MILQADARRIPLRDGCVQTVVTSPPYWGLRDYGTARWEGGDEDCEHSAPYEAGQSTNKGNSTTHQGRFVDCSCGARRIDLQIGLEPTPEAYVATMVEVFREVRRVLRDDGTCWLNLGDSYAGSWGNYGGQNRGHGAQRSIITGSRAINPAYEDLADAIPPQARVPSGLKPKDLCGIPWRVAFALQADGWWLRSAITLCKQNPMPESVQGSHCSRHRITIAEYENLLRVRAAKRHDENGQADLSGVSSREIFNRQTALSAEREGPSNGTSARTTGGRKGTAAAVQPIGARACQQSEVRGNSEGTNHATENHSTSSGKARDQGETTATRSSAVSDRTWARTEAARESALSPFRKREGDEGQDASEATGATAGSGCDFDGDGLGRDFEASQIPLLLLQAETETDDGSCDPAEQGRDAYESERSASLHALQLEKIEQIDDALVDCPGCSKCRDGYLVHLSAGRPTSATEMMFLLSKSASYFYDSEAIRETASDASLERIAQPNFANQTGGSKDYRNGINPSRSMRKTLENFASNPGRNMRNWRVVTSEPTPEAHFATFGQKWIEPCILAGTSEKGCCAKCGAPRVRQTESSYEIAGRGNNNGARKGHDGTGTGAARMYETRMLKTSTTIGWQPSCTHDAPSVPCLVLDPFLGSGTVGRVAERFGRRWVGLELSADYIGIAAKRTAQLGIMFGEARP